MDSLKDMVFISGLMGANSKDSLNKDSETGKEFGDLVMAFHSIKENMW